MDGNFANSAHTLPPPAKTSQFLTLKEFATHTGMSESTIRRRVRDKSLHAVQLGGKGKKLLFPIDALIRVNTSVTLAEDNAPAEPVSLPPSEVQSDDSAGSHPQWMQKLARRPR